MTADITAAWLVAVRMASSHLHQDGWHCEGGHERREESLFQCVARSERGDELLVLRRPLRQVGRVSVHALQRQLQHLASQRRHPRWWRRRRRWRRRRQDHLGEDLITAARARPRRRRLVHSECAAVDGKAVVYRPYLGLKAGDGAMEDETGDRLRKRTATEQRPCRRRGGALTRALPRRRGSGSCLTWSMVATPFASAEYLIGTQGSVAFV